MSSRRVVLALALAATLALPVLSTGASPQPGLAHADSVPGDFRLARLVGLADPAAWSEHDASGLRFRLATAHERAENAWPEGTFLVEMPDAAAAAQGAPEIALLVPNAREQARTLALSHVSEDAGRVFAETRVDGATRVFSPVFHVYATEAAETARVRLVASLEGGLTAMGADGDALLDLWGHQATWVVEDLPGAPPRERLVRVTLAAATPDAAVDAEPCTDGAACVQLASPPQKVDACDASITVVGEPCDRVQWRCANDDLACRTLCNPIVVLQQRAHPCEPMLGRCDTVTVVVSLRICAAAECEDGFDNDFDGRRDHPADPDCSGPGDNSEGGNAPAAQCADGRDNDGDGRADFPDDPACADPLDGDEGDDPACWDGADNDGDRWIDFPSDPGCSSERDDDEFDARTTYRFALMGEIRWCTNVGTNWPARLAALGDQIEATFDANGATRANPFHSFSHCWTASSASSAAACDASGGCTDGSGHAYPFNGCAGFGPCYRDNVWSDVTHARIHSSFDPVDAAQAMHLTTTRNTDGGGLCGIASFPTTSPYFGDSSGPAPSGDSMATDATTSCRPYVPAHEMGHVYNAIHEKGGCSVNGRPGVMLYHDARGNFFCDANRREVQRCNDELIACPREGRG